MILEQWETRFSVEISKKQKDLSKPGCLISIIPIHEEWDNFTNDVKDIWPIWSKSLDEYPYSLIILFAGLAFFEYSEKTFWPRFFEVLGSDISNPQQVRITKIYSDNLRSVGLRVLEKNNRISYVGSAVFHAGIPLSLWNDFLELCEWAVWNENWKSITDEEWDKLIKKLFFGISRLRSFLIDNRETAKVFIKEMLDAREICKDKNLTIQDLANICLLRTEYLEQIPETLEFLRPNSNVTFEGCAKLFWNDRTGQPTLYLPSIDKSVLPAYWQIEELKQTARSTPHEINISSEIFKPRLKIKLISQANEEIHFVNGIRSWGLFDISRGGIWVNTNRENLPLGNYLLISKEKIDEIKCSGFDENENIYNERITLKDGTVCYLSKFWPNKKYAEISIRYKTDSRKLILRRKAKIESKFFIGEGSEAANFIKLENNKFKIEGLPIICISLPKEYFKDNKEELKNRFKVFLGERLANGTWSKYDINQDEEKEFYKWDWGYKPFLEFKANEKGSYKGLQNINKFFNSPDLRGEHILSIRAFPGFYDSFNVYLEHTKKGVQYCFSELPGDYLLWYIICQPSGSFKWDEIMFAKDIICPTSTISNKEMYAMLRGYSDLDLIAPKGKSWKILQSVAQIINFDNECVLNYCGDPSKIWGLFRRLYHEIGVNNLVPIKVKRTEKNGLPYLQMRWNLNIKDNLLNYFKSSDIKIEETWKL